jgi:hypothetical protein
LTDAADTRIRHNQVPVQACCRRPGIRRLHAMGAARHDWAAGRNNTYFGRSVTAPTEAFDTRRAYFANTPVV